jgi:hypothetical protein
MARAKKKTTKAKLKATPALKRGKPAAKAEQPGLFEAAPPAPASAPSGKRIGMTLRLEPEMWVRLKNLSARLSVKMGRPVSAHELVVAGIKTLLLSYEAAALDVSAEDK